LFNICLRSVNIRNSVSKLFDFGLILCFSITFEYFLFLFVYKLSFVRSDLSVAIFDSSLVFYSGLWVCISALCFNWFERNLSFRILHTAVAAAYIISWICSIDSNEIYFNSNNVFIASTVDFTFLYVRYFWYCWSHVWI
jgi:hypothetical protein